MCLSSPRPPTPPPPAPAPPASAPAPSESPFASVREDVQRKRAATQGGTILTGPRGVVDGVTAKPKTLLGG